MIEKMRFLSITGPRDDFDRVVNQYLSKYSIHLENALTELKTNYSLKPFVEINPYKDLLQKSEDLIKQLDNTNRPSKDLMTREEATQVIDSAYTKLAELSIHKDNLKQQRNKYNELLTQIEHYRPFDYDMQQIMDLKFIKFRFGKIPQEFYTRFSKYVYDNLTTVFLECDRDKDYVWGIYFVPSNEADKIDAIYASLHFEQVLLPNAYQGTPEEAYNSIMTKIKEIDDNIQTVQTEINQNIRGISEDLLLAHHTINTLSLNFDVRKMAACTRQKDSNDVFYILSGWITEKESKNLLEEIDKDNLVCCIVNDQEQEEDKTPPTKLKNFVLFKPFEMFIKMYGLPAYNEIDPTSIIALTYSLIFGIMFGDVGQGLCLIIAGLLLYKLKKMTLAAIIAICGLFSVLFGFMYGSIFGFEGNPLHPIWLSPRDSAMTVLFTAVGFGVLMILVAMILNIINSIKAKDWGRVFFDTNGIAGLVFYGSLIGSILLIVTKNTLPGVLLILVCFIIPIILIFFKEPLTHVIQKKKKIFPDQKGMFFVETSFEIFEILLSYFSNTISFLRVGAFAISHAGMMAVVMLLAKTEAGGLNIPVLILGNIFVTVMEGLIVGIQVLRLEYYEMFSRFYRGTGKEFKPYKSK